MIRPALVIASLAVLATSAGGFGRSRNAADAVDRVQGARIVSRIPCDGSTNPQDELKLVSTFSPGGWQRAFHLDMFQSRYCRMLDAYFVCVIPGHNRWKHAWVQDSQGTPLPGRVWIDSCSAWGSKDAPEYILSGWYRESGADRKEPWKQGAVRKVSERPEIYEFTDPDGGTARVEIRRK